MKTGKLLRIGFPVFLASGLTLVGCNHTGQRNVLVCDQQIPEPAGILSESTLLTHLRVLSHDDMEGRKTGSTGSEKAARYIATTFQQTGVSPWVKDYRQPFSTLSFSNENNAKNIIGVVHGKITPERYVVMTAHYDHLGRKGHQIYNGADDNASGVAALLTIAEKVANQPLNYSVIFAALDAEEKGLFGAKALFRGQILPDKSQIAVNINMDMIGQGGKKNRLIVAGTRPNPQLKPVIQQVINEASVCLMPGHDKPEPSLGYKPVKIDWTDASDHAEFHERGIPFLYFGVDDHRFYHTPGDTFETINPKFFVSAAEAVWLTLNSIDEYLLTNNKT